MLNTVLSTVGIHRRIAAPVTSPPPKPVFNPETRYNRDKLNKEAAKQENRPKLTPLKALRNSNKSRQEKKVTDEKEANAYMNWLKDRFDLYVNEETGRELRRTEEDIKFYNYTIEHRELNYHLINTGQQLIYDKPSFLLGGAGCSTKVCGIFGINALPTKMGRNIDERTILYTSAGYYAPISKSRSGLLMRHFNGNGGLEITLQGMVDALKNTRELDGFEMTVITKFPQTKKGIIKYEDESHVLGFRKFTDKDGKEQILYGDSMIGSKEAAEYLIDGEVKKAFDVLRNNDYKMTSYSYLQSKHTIKKLANNDETRIHINKDGYVTIGDKPLDKDFIFENKILVPSMLNRNDDKLFLNKIFMSQLNYAGNMLSKFEEEEYGASYDEDRTALMGMREYNVDDYKILAKIIDKFKADNLTYKIANAEKINSKHPKSLDEFNKLLSRLREYPMVQITHFINDPSMTIDRIKDELDANTLNNLNRNLEFGIESIDLEKNIMKIVGDIDENIKQSWRAVTDLDTLKQVNYSIESTNLRNEIYNKLILLQEKYNKKIYLNQEKKNLAKEKNLDDLKLYNYKLSNKITEAENKKQKREKGEVVSVDSSDEDEPMAELVPTADEDIGITEPASMKKGGIVKGKKGQAVPIIAHEGELVVPKQAVQSVIHTKAWKKHVEAIAKKEGISFAQAKKHALGQGQITRKKPKRLIDETSSEESDW